MRILRTDKQKDNLAKFFWDMAKVAFTLLVVGPFAVPENVSMAGLLRGVAVGFLLAFIGHLLDGREVLK